MNKIQTHKRQQGFISIIVAAMIMILLSLITIGFTRIMQREAREALDRQLTRQATYAAESGIHSVWQYIREDSVQEEKNQCSNGGDVFKLDDGTDIEYGTPAVKPSPYFDDDNASAGVQITCVLYDKNPQTLRWNSGEGDDNIAPIESKDGSNFETITVTWSGGDGSIMASCTDSTALNFPQSHTGTPLLRMDLTNTASFDRTNLSDSTHFFYLIPCDSGATTITLSNNRTIEKSAVQCSGAVCSVDLDVSSIASNRFFVRHRLIYGGGDVSISAEDPAGDAIELKGAQSVIDITARSTDVVKRLQANLPMADSDGTPSAVVSIGSGGGSSNPGLCKEIAIIDNGPTQEIDNKCND